jgi:acetyltransferase-like isoleucine patch superfamily enzyme
MIALKFLLEHLSYPVLESLELAKLKAKYPTLHLEPNVQIKSSHLFEIGTDVLIQRNTVIHCGGKAWCDYKGRIVLGSHIAIGPNSVLYGAGEIFVNDFTHLGPGVQIISQAGNPLEERLVTKHNLLLETITIGKGCWIGSNAVILGGTTLGDYCTVAPNSVVKGCYPDYTVLIGNPARASLNLKLSKQTSS